MPDSFIRSAISILSVIFFYAPAFAAGDEAVATSSSHGNVRTSAGIDLIGYYNLDIAVRLADQWTLGPVVSFQNFNDKEYIFRDGLKSERTSLGVRGVWSPNGNFAHGWYVAPTVQLYYFHTKGTVISNSVVVDQSVSGVYAAIGAGYHWFFPSGFNVGTGIELGGSSQDRLDLATNLPVGTAANMSKTTVSFVDISLGWVF